MRIPLLAFAVSVAITSGTLAQTRPDFSGTWTLDEKRSGSPAHDAFVGPVVWVIEQSGQVLVVNQKRGDKSLALRYTIFDKPPAAHADTTVNSPTGEAPVHRGYWDGDRLITETLQNIQGKTVTTRESLTLTSNGEMVVERVVEVEHGYTPRGAQNFSTVKDVFTKTAR